LRKTWAVAKREFAAFVRTKAFVFGTLFGPLVLLVILALPVLFSSGSGGIREIAVVSDPGSPLGEEVASRLGPASASGVEGGLEVEVVHAAPEESEAARTRLRRLVAADSIDGYVVLPHDLEAGEMVRYEGRTVTAFGDIERIRTAVENAIQVRRLIDAGVDPEVVSDALAPVAFEIRAIAEEEVTGGTPDSIFGLAYFLSFATYMVVLLYGIAVLRGVQEEKDQRVVEILLSSLRPRQLMQGKVLGIAAAGLLQVSVWVIFAGAALAWAPDVAAWLGVRPLDLPPVSAAFALVYLFFFLGGYLLYAALYAALGAIATSSQEANQLQYPALLPLMIAFFAVFAVIQNPDGTLAVAGSLIPFTSPLIFPVRWLIAPVPWSQTALAMALLASGVVVILWLAGAVFRVTILATGSRPSWRQIARWMRAS
jgi:ABC-2 type transport system permease protein